MDNIKTKKMLKICKVKLKQLFCIHDLHINNIDDFDVVCWHWTHGPSPNNYPLFIQMQLKCKKCGDYYFRCIFNRKLCDHFAEYYKDKRDDGTSKTCKPVL